jgi:hypothetical protein
MQLFNTFLQLCLAALTFAAPIADEISIQKDNAWQYGTGGGILGFIILIIDIIVWGECGRILQVDHIADPRVLHSRGHPIHASRQPQASLEFARLHLPHCWSDCLLFVLEP